MTELYLRDDVFANGTGPRMSANDMRQILFDCRIEAPLYIKQKPKGFIVKFRNEDVVNQIMMDPNYINLIDRNLTPDLSKDSRFYREVLISDIPNTIYDEESDNDMWDELEYQNNIKIRQFVAYKPRHTTCNFIKIVLDTRAEKDNLRGRSHEHGPPVTNENSF